MLAQRRDTYNTIKRFASSPDSRSYQALRWLLDAQQYDVYNQAVATCTNLGLGVQQDTITKVKCILLQVPIPGALKQKAKTDYKAMDFQSLYESTISTDRKLSDTEQV